MSQREVGIGGFSWHKDADTLAREATAAREIGYRWAYGDGGVWAEGALEQALSVLGQEGLKIWSTHGITGINEWEFDIDGAVERMGEQVRRVGGLGIENVTYHTMVNDTNREPDSIVAVRRDKFTQRFHELFGRLAPLAESCGVSMNVENIDGTFDSTYRTADEILSITEPVGSPAMGVCVDSGHAHMTGLSPAEMIRRFGPRLTETHFHDNRGDTDDHRPVGIGTIDWADVIMALDEVEFSNPVVFEWAGTYWTELQFAPIARTFYATWRQFEDYADSLNALDA